MRLLVSLILVLSFIIINLSVLTSCSGKHPANSDGSSTGNSGNGACTDEDCGGVCGNPEHKPQNGTIDSGIIVPPYGNFDRPLFNLSDVTYKRPDIQGLSDKYAALAENIENNAISFEDAAKQIAKLKKEHNSVSTMASLAEFGRNSDLSDKFWSAEYKFISTEAPKLSYSYERLLVAAANSPHSSRYESSVFGMALADKYGEGGIYNEELVALLSEEAALLFEFSELHGAAVEITYNGRTDTYDTILAEFKDKASPQYLMAKTVCDMLLSDEMARRSESIYIELLKLRSKIGEAYLDGDYIDFIYKCRGVEYSESKVLLLTDSISEYVVEIKKELAKKYVFEEYKKILKPDKLDKATLINSTFYMLDNLDCAPELINIYSYMLRCELYSIAEDDDSVGSDSLTVYLNNGNAPMLFLNTKQNTSDYGIFLREFGSYADNYLNRGKTSSHDMSLLCEYALELLMLTRLDIKNSTADDHLKLYTLESYLNKLTNAALYTVFEHYVYDIPYSEINRESIADAAHKAALDMGISLPDFDDGSAAIRSILNANLIEAPFSSESDSVSIITALDIYFKELRSEGSGFGVYMTLLNRKNMDLSFEEHLNRASAASPFDEKTVKDVADEIYYKMYGKYYFSESNGESAA